MSSNLVGLAGLDLDEIFRPLVWNVLVRFVDGGEDGPDFIQFVLQRAIYLLQVADSVEEFFLCGHSPLLT